MRHFLILFLALSSVPVLGQAQNIGLVSSEIDWAASELALEAYTAETPTAYYESLFRCNGMEYADLAGASISLPLSILGFSGSGAVETTESGTLNSCMQQAGTYQFKLRLVDKAGNSTEDDFSMTVRPATPEATGTILAPVAYETFENGASGDGEILTTDCAADSLPLVANNRDYCKLELTLKDRFSNYVDQSTIEIDLLDGSADSDLNLIADPDDFYNGLRLDNRPNFVGINVNQGTDRNFDFQVRALAPSLEVVSGNPDVIADSDGDGVADFAMGIVTPKPVSFEITAQPVDKSGNLMGGDVTFNETINLRFNPLIHLALTDIDPTSDGTLTLSDFENPQRSDPLQIFNGIPGRYYVLASTLLDHLLPNNFTAVVQEGTVPGILFINESLDPLSVEFSGVTTPSDFREIDTTLVTDGAVLGSENLSLISRVNYSLGGTSVTHPGGNLGNQVGSESLTEDPFPTDPDTIGLHGSTVTGAIVGADIEGQVLSTETIRTYGDTQAVSVGGISAADVREDVFESSFRLIRGLEPRTGSQTINRLDGTETIFNQNGVAYFRGGTVTLGDFAGDTMVVDGVKTIVIEDGNLLVLENLEYADAEASLGVVLLNTEIPNFGPTILYPEEGHVFLHNSVQHVVGTYFMDGSLVSTDQTNPTIDNPVTNVAERESSNPAAPFARQLIFEGIFLGNNTLGAAFLPGSYRTPWVSVSDANRDQAVKFDLHFVRRYTPNISGVANCYNDGAGCDNNNYAFVVRPDARVNTNPPPGFTTVQAIGAN